MVNPEMKEFSPGERLIRSWRGKGIWNLIAAQPITSGHKYPLMNHKFLSPDKKKERKLLVRSFVQLPLFLTGKYRRNLKIVTGGWG